MKLTLIITEIRRAQHEDMNIHFSSTKPQKMLM